MILGIRQQFVQPILQGTKIHTLRPLRSKPIKVGTKLQFTTDSRFKKGKRNIVAEFEVLHVQLFKLQYVHFALSAPSIQIVPPNYTGILPNYGAHKVTNEIFAKNDGFDYFSDFVEFMFQLYHKPFFRNSPVFQCLVFQQPKSGVLPIYLKGDATHE